MLDLTDWQNKKYTTRDGTPVRILCVDAKGEQPVIGLRLREDGIEVVDNWSLNGEYLIVGHRSGTDLINAKTKREGWVNVYPNYDIGALHRRKESADADNIGRVACVRIEWEE